MADEIKDPKGEGRESDRSSGTPDGFSDEERAAMRERAQEIKSQRRGSRSAKTDPEADVLAKIAEMSEPDRSMAAKVHDLVMKTAPELTPRTWYGMPAYTKDGNVVCFFQNASKFKARYQTLGFSDKARLDDGAMWPTTYAITELNEREEQEIVALVKKALGR